MIHLVITSANIPEAYEERKRQYIHSIESCLKYSALFDSYTILECVSKNEEYLNEYNTYYSKEGNRFKNKGLNEMTHLRAFLKKAGFQDGDGIIKLSGKYIVNDSYFFEQVIEKQDRFDSMFKDDSDIYVGNGYHTFLYYMKKRTFLETIATMEFSRKNQRPIEWDVKNHLKTSNTNFVIDRLGLTAYQGTLSDRVFDC